MVRVLPKNDHLDILQRCVARPGVHVSSCAEHGMEEAQSSALKPGEEQPSPPPAPGGNTFNFPPSRSFSPFNPSFQRNRFRSRK